MKPSAIQFIGTQRSGSNLLRVMLNQLPEISAPHPPHILKTFFPLLPLYGNLEQEENFLALTSDVCEWVNINPVPWEGIHFDAESIIQKCHSNTLIEVFRLINELKAQQKGARFWCCKSMESVAYMKELEASGIQPFYIYLYRDGRDVALSFLKAIVGPKHIYHLALKWREEQELALRAKDQVPSNRFISISYEELISNPKMVLINLCQQLGVYYQDSMLDYFHSNESSVTAQSGVMWSNLTKPVLVDNHHKFLKELTPEQIGIFEVVAGDVLLKLGYPLTQPEKEFYISADVVERFNKENSDRILEALRTARPQDVEKRKPQEELLNRIKKRGVL